MNNCTRIFRQKCAIKRNFLRLLNDSRALTDDSGPNGKLLLHLPVYRFTSFDIHKSWIQCVGGVLPRLIAAWAAQYNGTTQLIFRSYQFHETTTLPLISCHFQFTAAVDIISSTALTIINIVVVVVVVRISIISICCIRVIRINILQVFELRRTYYILVDCYVSTTEWWWWWWWLLQSSPFQAIGHFDGGAFHRNAHCVSIEF